MYKTFTKTKATVNRGSAMGAETIQNTRVIPKNQKSRRSFLIICVMGFLFCVGTNNVIGQSWNIGHNPVQGGNYLPTVTATLNGNTLIISGNGNMADFFCTGTNQYDAGGEAPWYPHRNDILTVIFQSGSNVTNIGMRAFKECINLQMITIPNSVGNINGQAFFNCSNLHTVIIENGNSPIEFRGYRSSNPCGTTGVINTYDWFSGTSIATLYFLYKS